MEVEKPTSTASKRRHRRLRGKRNKFHKDASKVDRAEAASTINIDEQTNLYLECSLCGAKRRFHVDTHNECWVERTEAIVQVLQSNQTDIDGNKGENEMVQE